PMAANLAKAGVPLVVHDARPAAAAAAGAKPRTRRRAKVGMVVSAKHPHSVVVTIERLREHPLYKKVIKVRKRFAAHDAAGDVREGDLVRIQESRAFSKTKRWQVVEVLSRAGEAGAAAPRVAEVELALETAEGVRELLQRPAREADTAEPGPEAERGDQDQDEEARR
ncbi:MAG: 30S ribosomal protein S17, partial [Candidatus Limnocylindria bacterium]